MRCQEVIEAHRQAGRRFSAGGLESFVREQGTGPAVLFVHGMWGSSFLYRKVLGEVAARGLRGIAWDLPGFGFAERPADYDYSWSGLGRFCVRAADALELDRFNLVVHDIGGPVGLELAAAMPDRVASITVLNTMIDVAGFQPPWTMRPFRRRLIGELWLAGMSKPLFRRLMRMQGIADQSQVSTAELDAILALMKGPDGGRAFLKIMRSTERTPEKQALYRRTLGQASFPVQVVWAVDDPALRLDTHGEQARRAAGLERIERIPGRHFPQEDQAPAIAEHIAAVSRRAQMN